jgi:hypothetical protein
MNNRRHALSLAAVLTATVLTGGAAILGLVHTPAQHVAQPVVVQQQAQQPSHQFHEEEGD